MMSFNQMHDVELLHHLRDAWKLVQRFENDEERMGELPEYERKLAIKLARKHFAEVLTEAAKREINFMECLQ